MPQTALEIPVWSPFARNFRVGQNFIGESYETRTVNEDCFMLFEIINDAINTGVLAYIPEDYEKQWNCC